MQRLVLWYPKSICEGREVQAHFYHNMMSNVLIDLNGSCIPVYSAMYIGVYRYTYRYTPVYTTG
jgi:hypothetical protein